MPETSQSAVEKMVERATKLGDPILAQDIRAFAAERQFGLVFEHNRPERMRLYGKPITTRDIVQVLPKRGEEGPESKLLWRVASVDGEDAKLTAYRTTGYTKNNNSDCEAKLCDLVAIAEYDQPIYAGLEEVDRVERGGDSPYHVVINGENYHALEMLEFCYAGKVDCIYIDPPYNTGAKDWKYNNDYVDGSDQYRHSKWLAFMERRLKLAKQLLNPEDSVLIVTIDEKERDRLGLLLEQMFPEARIQMVSSVISTSGVARNGFARCDEYIYFVMFGAAAPTALQLPNIWSQSLNKVMSPDTHEPPKLGWESMMRRGSHSHRTDRPGLYYAIYVDEQTKCVKQCSDVIPAGQHENRQIDGLVQVLPIRTDGSEGCWQVGPESFRERLEQGRIRVGSKTPYGYVIQYLADGEYAKITNRDYIMDGHADDGSLIAHPREDWQADPWIAPTQWKVPAHDATTFGTDLLRDIIGKGRFSYPKSLYAVHDVLRFFVANKPDALIVDFFAGSGTTLHAVNLLNAEDGGHRRCVCVTNNEVSSDEQKAFVKRGLRPGDPDWEAHGIARYATWPRTKCSIEGVDVYGEPLKGDYGCPVESYDEIEGDVTDPETGKKIRGKVYKKVKKPSYPELADMKMSDGFKANAIFFDLTYQDPVEIELGAAFHKIAPLLWLKAGSFGKIIYEESDTYSLSECYGVLFNYSFVSEFIEKVQSKPEIGTVFIVTDDEGRYASLKSQLPDVDVVQLYESYLRSFRIAAEDSAR